MAGSDMVGPDGADPETGQGRRGWLQRAVRLLNGVGFGLLTIAAFYSVIGRETMTAMDRSSFVAFFVAFVYIMCGMLVALGSLMPQVGVHMLNVPDAEDLADRRVVIGLSGLCAIATGAMLMVVVFAVPGGPLPPVLALGGVAALWIAIGWIGWRLYRILDELDQLMGLETAGWGFYAIGIFGGGWAILAQLGFAGAPAPLDWLSMILVAPLAASIVSAGKRGMLVAK